MRNALRLRLVFVGLVGALGAAAAGPAQAGFVDITYSLTGSLQVLCGNPPVPCFTGTPGSGTSIVRATTASASQTAVIAGPLHVQAFQFLQAFSPMVAGAAGHVKLTGQSNPGSLLPTGGLFVVGPLHVQSGLLHCLTTSCAAFWAVTQSVNINLFSVSNNVTLVGAVTPMLAGFVIQGPAGTFLGKPLRLTLTGTEVSRAHPVPEPGTVWLLGSAALAGLFLRWRRIHG